MNDVKSVYFWAPFIDKVATIKAVSNSVNSINKYSKGKFKPKIINGIPVEQAGQIEMEFICNA